jgi:hypothetical protein
MSDSIDLILAEELIHAFNGHNCFHHSVDYPRQSIQRANQNIHQGYRREHSSRCAAKGRTTRKQHDH